MSLSTRPENPIKAAIHANPNPYYTELAADKALYYDHALHMWIAASAEVVNAVLTSGLCRVRPAAEPVPAALVGSTAGQIFGALVRMTDGQGHAVLKAGVSAALDTLNSTTTFEVSLRHARTLATKYIPNRLTDFAFNLPVYVVADLLGVPPQQHSLVALWMADFVRCLSPISTVEQIEQGKQAADQLFDLFGRLLSQQTAEKNPTLLDYLSQILSQVNIPDSTLVLSNAIGFISQTYEATAGLIGNALVALAAHPDIDAQVRADVTLLPLFVDEVARFDSPVQNTRRFVAADGIVAGQVMKADDSILVLLAAANGDKTANPKPEIFNLGREHSRCFSFGAGSHACPGQSLTKSITQAALHQIFVSGLDVTALSKPINYRPSTNTRVPLLNV
ncbi:MAG: cytochrome P450 [Anaerolineae bacterium]|nr:cytochrome P450 [Anaerolineae bacterium]